MKTITLIAASLISFSALANDYKEYQGQVQQVTVDPVTQTVQAHLATPIETSCEDKQVVAWSLTSPYVQNIQSLLVTSWASFSQVTIQYANQADCSEGFAQGALVRLNQR